MSRILAIHAHPDDVEFLAGGTLALLARAGHALTVATMTAGDCGSAGLSAPEISAVRMEEANASARLIGADYRWCGFFDLAIFNDDASRRRVTELLRLVGPEIVITGPPVDYMADHENTSALVRDACFGASVPLYRTRAASPAPPLNAIPHLYYMDPFSGFYPDGAEAARDFCVDVQETFAAKQAMLAQHGSQREWLRRQHGVEDYMLQMEASTRAAGERFGFRFGECFRQYKGHAYPQTPLLQELLGPAAKAGRLIIV